MIRPLRTAGGTLPPFGRAVLVALVLAAPLLAAWVLSVNRVGPFAGGGYVVEARFRDAGGISAGDEALVTVAGVAAGRVAGVRHEDGVAVLELRLDDGTRGLVHRGATATVRPRSQLGDRVVELTPGRLTARALGDGDRLGPGATSASVPFSRVAAALDADTRTWLQLLVSELDTGVGDDTRGRRLAAAVRGLEPLTASASSVSSKLRERRTALTRLVRDLDVLATATGRRSRELRGAIVAARRVLGVTGDGAADLRAMVGALPTTLAETRRALASVTTFGEHVDPALATLAPTVRELPRTLRTVRAALPGIDALTSEAGTTARAAAAPAGDLGATVRAARTAVPALRPTTVRAGSIVHDVDRNRDGIGLLGERFSGIFSTADRNGTMLRGLGFFEPFSPAHFGFSPATPKARAAEEVVRATVRTCRTNVLACLLPFSVPGLQAATQDLLAERRAAPGATAVRRATRGTGRSSTSAAPASATPTPTAKEAGR